MKKINDFTNEYAFLSNYYECPVIYDNLSFCSAEAAYHAQKEKQRECEFIFLSPDDARHLSRTLTNIRSDWDDVKLDVMYNIVKAKFTQNRDLKEKLLATGDAHLEEEGWWNDQYWGVYQGKGENHLGKILMKIREELK